MSRLRAFLDVMMRMFIIMVGTYLVIWGALWIFQKHMIFVPIQETTAAPSNQGIEEVTFQTNDRVKLHGWFTDNGGNYTVLFFHGNGGNILYNSERLPLFRDLGVNSLIFDYRSYGQSEGTIQSENDFYTDAQTAYNYLIARGIPESKIILWGHSLGGAVAINTALEKNVRALIVESSFVSLDEMAKFRAPLFPVSYLLNYHFPSIDRIEKIQIPKLFMHSQADQVISFWQWKKLYETATGKKEFLEIYGDHNRGIEKSYEIYLQWIWWFLRE